MELLIIIGFSCNYISVIKILNTFLLQSVYSCPSFIDKKTNVASARFSYLLSSSVRQMRRTFTASNRQYILRDARLLAAFIVGSLRRQGSRVLCGSFFILLPLLPTTLSFFLSLRSLLSGHTHEPRS